MTVPGLIKLSVPKKERVVTIHGVNSHGPWQEDVAKTLGALFEFIPVKYNHYRWFFGSELLFCPLVWMPLIPCVGLAFWFGWIRGTMHLVLAGLAILLTSFLATFPYRNWAVSVVKGRLSNAAPGIQRPHVIAHSFGTYVSGDTLATLPATKFGRAILVGCVLDADFMHKHYKSWGFPQIGVGTDMYHVLAVRNEMASRDWIVRLAAKLDRCVPGFGAAGSAGFSGPVDLVHSVNTPNAACGYCWPSAAPGSAAQPSVSPAVVHNVLCQGLRHSDYFLGANHAILYWIPFLWGYDPALYRRFLFTCLQIRQAHDRGDPTAMLDNYKAMRQSPWGQFPKKTIDEAITDWFQKDLRRDPSDRELDAVAAETLRFVLMGQEAMDYESYEDRETWIRCLNPSVAAQLAYEKVPHGE
jgi:pimeloyl-ACP methyl ester carboxylesterase